MTTNINTRIDALTGKIDTLSQQVTTLAAQMVSRTEIDDEVGTRVSRERFDAEVSSLRERLSRLESGPQKMLGWISLVVSGAVGCLTLIVTALAALVAIGVAIIPHLH